MSLLEYLRQQNWTGRPAGHGEYVGLCPLHEESRPSFYVNTHKDVFYCHGCGQGGDLIRFLQLSHPLAFHEGLAYLDPMATREKDAIAVLEQAATFYQHQLDQHPEALGYL
jgi:DNA primase